MRLKAEPIIDARWLDVRSERMSAWILAQTRYMLFASREKGAGRKMSRWERMFVDATEMRIHSWNKLAPHHRTSHWIFVGCPAGLAGD